MSHGGYAQDIMLLPVYSRPPITFARGEGCWLYDTTGRRYLDLLSGIGVNALGHGHPRLVRAITEQAARGLHVSNLFHHPYQAPLADRLLALAGGAHEFVFFSNSGSEAMEAALKAAKARGRHGLVALAHGFHGSTAGALSITAAAKYRAPFEPLVPGAGFVEPEDLDALRAAVSEQTAAIIVEPIQGEGGIRPMSEAFLREAQRLARAHDALFIADETQCGLGRTGEWFAFERVAGLTPDIVVTAKPLAAGLPLGAALFNARAAEGLGPGSHGTTFGGGPLACRVALEVLEVIEELRPAIRTNGAYLLARLEELGGVAVRGRGLMAGVELGYPAAPVAAALLERGVIVNATAHSVLRLLPPFIITRAEIDQALEPMRAIIEACGGSPGSR